MILIVKHPVNRFKNGMNKNNQTIFDDQIMQLDTRLWSVPFFKNLSKDLKSTGWQTQNYCGPLRKLVHSSTNEVIVMLAMHHPPKSIELDPNITLVTDVVLRDYNNNCISLYPEIFGEHQIDLIYQNRLPTKDFNCFIHRGCFFRQSWIYQLVRRKILDQGHVSYWCHDRFTEKSPQEYFETLFQNNLIFEQEHTILQGKIPFKNFTISIEDAIIDSKISLVIETFFDDNRFCCYSEKIWRNIQLPRPWLMFNSQHAVRNLREWGFDVLDNYVDHSYDQEPDPVKRQLMILDQLVRPIDYTYETLTILESCAEKNRQLLKHYKNLLPSKYKKIVSDINSIIVTPSRSR